MSHWHLMYTKPHKEPQVNRLLQQREIETFFPVIQLKHGYRNQIRIEPFFPNYLFFRTDFKSVDSSGLQWLPGARTVVHFAGQPAIVPDDAIAAMQHRFAAYTEKVLHKGEWLFKPGEEVEIIKGPLAGLNAIFQTGLTGKDRVQVLVHILGAWSRTELATGEIARRSG